VRMTCAKEWFFFYLFTIYRRVSNMSKGLQKITIIKVKIIKKTTTTYTAPRRVIDL
jgi:hypothetical protein